jgi:CHAT domain-containing protein/uncharacterized protein HemY
LHIAATYKFFGGQYATFDNWKRGCSMSFTLRLSFGFLALSLTFISPNLAQSQSATPGTAAQHSADVAELRSMAEAFFGAWAAKDLDAFLRLWSAGSPELESRRKEEQELFATSERIEIRSLNIRAVNMDGGQARVRVEIDVRVIEAQSGKEKAGYGKMPRTLEYVKEAGHWKVRREASTYDEIVAALAAAGSEQQRTALLAEERELLSAGLVRALLNQGNRFFDQGDFMRALVMYRQAQNMAEQLGDQTGAARAQNNIGNVHATQGDYAQASEYFRKSLAMSETLGDPVAIANSLRNLGNIQQIQGDFAQALFYFRRGLEISEKLEDSAGIARSLGSLGNVYNLQGDFTQALEYYRKCLMQFEAMDDKLGIARTLANIATVQYDQGDYEQALESKRQSLTLFEQKGDKAGSAITLSNIGNNYAVQGNYAQALEYYQQSMKLKEAVGDKFGMAKTLVGIGLIHFNQSNYAQALEYFLKSLAIQEGLRAKSGIAETLNHIGDVHDLQGDSAKALEYFQRSLAMREANEEKSRIAYTLNSIGNVHQRQGNYAKALELYQKSLAMNEASGDKDGIASSLLNLGSVYHDQGDYEQAVEYAERGATIARSIGDNETLRRSLTIAGRAYRQLHKTFEARQALAEAIATIETLRVQAAGGEDERQRSFAFRVSPYHALADLLIAQGKPAEALNFAERAKSRVLLDVLQAGRVNINKALTREERDQERRQRAELISINTQLTRASLKYKSEQTRLEELKSLREKARLDYEAFRTSLHGSHPELKVNRGEASIINAEELDALLPDATSALLEYVVTDEATYLFVVTRPQGQTAAEIKVFTIPINQTELAKQIEGFRRRVAERNLGVRAPARKLYDLLLKPAQSLLGGKSSLVIVPDDRLWELPFQALLDERDLYLIERSAVSYAPSLTVLREMRARSDKRRFEAAPSTLLALGNPLIGQETVERARLSLRDGKLYPLPEAEAEVRALGRLYGARRSKVYIGKAAREDRLKAEAGRARILHFATHGVMNNAAPLYSYLALARGDKNEDGLLEAWELMQLDLKADLAVLSACETARGRTSAGEGMIGLTWALFVAGTPATVVSQWEVESASARDLMLGFHRQLQAPRAAGKLTKAESLRRAAIKMMKNPKTNHPFYWAGFVLVGDGR